MNSPVNSRTFSLSDHLPNVGFGGMGGRPSKRLHNAPNRIREVRIAKGMTLKQVADACGLAPQNIADYETGKTKGLPLWRLEQIAATLGVPAYTLLRDYDVPRDADEREVLRILRHRLG